MLKMFLSTVAAAAVLSGGAFAQSPQPMEPPAQQLESPAPEILREPSSPDQDRGSIARAEPPPPSAAYPEADKTTGSGLTPGEGLYGAPVQSGAPAQARTSTMAQTDTPYEQQNPGVAARQSPSFSAQGGSGRAARGDWWSRGYGRVDLGLGFAGDVEFDGGVTGPGGTGALPFATDSDFDLGWQASGALGLDEFPLPNWRAEIEAVYTDNETDDSSDNFDDVFDVGDEDIDTASADVNVFGGFVNLIYDFDFVARFVPYLGAGVGYGQVEVGYDNLDAEDEAFLWQIKAGVSYEWTDRATWEFGYRYLNAGSADFDAGDLDLNVSGEVDTEIHSATVGLRFNFGP